MPAQPLAANGTVTFTVAGVAGVPSDADAVVLDVTALNPPAKGFLTVYNTDSADPGIATVGLRASGVMNEQTTTVPVGAGKTVSLSNHSSGSLDIVASVVGYYQSAGATAAGDTYFGLPWAEIADTTTGFKVPQAQIPAGGSLTFQVTGNGGIAAGADTAVVQVNAINATASGYLTAYAAGGTDPGVAALSYNSDTYYRNVLYVPVSSSGQATLTNHGSAPVDVSVYARGCYMPPATTPAGGEHWPLDAQAVYGTATAGTQLAANASATFQVTGTGDIPDSGVSAVTEDVIVSNPTAQGRLNEGPADGVIHPVVSFLAGDTAYAGYDDGLVSTLSPTGQETITNDSSGTIDVQVAVTGFFASPTQPSAPATVTATVSSSSATVSWTAPATDGGSPITGYTVAATGDGTPVTVTGGTYQATLSGLATAATDTFTVTATNAAGTSDAAAFSPTSLATVSGTVDAPVATGATPVPVAGDTIDIFAADPPDMSVTNWTLTQIGTTTTDANGNWSFVVPPYASLPAAAQTAAANNGGVLNIEADAYGFATAGTTTYLENSTADEPAWVGTTTQTAPPANAPVPASQVMTLEPFGQDQSSLDTTTAQCQTWASVNYSESTDSSGNSCGTSGAEANAEVAAPADANGYQAITPISNYDPNVAADGTNLAGVHVAVPEVHVWCGVISTTKQNEWHSWAIMGEQHAGWDATTSFSLGHGGEVTIGAEVSADGDVFHVSGSASYTRGGSTTLTWPGSGPKASFYDKMNFNFVRLKIEHGCRTDGGPPWDISYTWKRREWGIHNFTNASDYKLGTTNVYSSMDGPTGLASQRNDNPNYVTRLHRSYPGDPPSSICIAHDHARTYAGGVSLAGIGVSVETTYNSVTEECVIAGTKTAHTHWVWSKFGNPVTNGGRQLKTIHSG